MEPEDAAEVGATTVVPPCGDSAVTSTAAARPSSTRTNAAPAPARSRARRGSGAGVALTRERYGRRITAPAAVRPTWGGSALRRDVDDARRPHDHVDDLAIADGARDAGRGTRERLQLLRR